MAAKGNARAATDLAANRAEALAVSLTQIWVPRSTPFSAAVADHQKHRVKKLDEARPTLVARVTRTEGTVSSA